MVSASDIITYAGVPLAVIGVLPSLYTFFKSLVTLRDIRRTLSQNGVGAITRGSMLSGIVEIEIPRKSITPLERDDPLYFELSERPSSLRGGTWSVFCWRELVIGHKALRLQYHDELAQPQAEVDLEALVAFLLDRGAIPDPQGFSDLRSSGHWTPAGTKLLVSPDRMHAVLSVSGSEDSEGLLSLKVNWRPEWSVRGPRDLPPYWMRLHGSRDDMGSLGIIKVKDDELEEDQGEKEKKEEKHTSVISEKQHGHTKSNSGQFLHVRNPSDHHQSTHKRHSSISKNSISEKNPFSPHEAERPLSIVSYATSRYTHHPTGILRLRLSSSGVDEIINEDFPKRKMRPRHLRQFHANEGNNSAAMWFSCAATALSAPRGGLWSFSIPPAVTTFCLLDSVPCGVMELWGFMTTEETPVWRTPVDNSMEEIEKREREQKRIRTMMDESRLKGQAWHEAVHKRFHEERREKQFAEERRVVEEQRRKAAEMVEALGSARMGIRPVAEACRKWLVGKELVAAGDDIAAIVERLLWEMVTKQEAAFEMARVLDLWKHWADNGGMTKSQYDEMQQSLTAFAYASCLLYLIADTAEAMSGSVVSDLQECLRLWKRIRLG
jgi:hypothetical protein